MEQFHGDFTVVFKPFFCFSIEESGLSGFHSGKVTTC